MFEITILALLTILIPVWIYLRFGEAQGFFCFWKNFAQGTYKICLKLLKIVAIAIVMILVLCLVIAFPVLLVIPAIWLWTKSSAEQQRSIRDLAVTAAALAFIFKK